MYISKYDIHMYLYILTYIFKCFYIHKYFMYRIWYINSYISKQKYVLKIQVRNIGRRVMEVRKMCTFYMNKIYWLVTCLKMLRKETQKVKNKWNTKGG